MGLISAFIPIWVLATVGYLARRRGLLGDESASVLGRFVFHLSMPAALFLTLAATPVSRFSFLPLVAFGVSTAAVVGVGWLAVSRFFDRKPAERPIWGMTAGYVNSANLGIPIAQQVLGSMSFLAEVVLVQTLVVTPVILIALDRHSGAVGRAGLRRVASLPVRNPVILASLLGVVWSTAALPVPSYAADPLKLLASAAVPTALVALGASLYSGPRTSEGPAASPAELAAVTALKLIAQPAIAFAVGLLLHLSAAHLLTVVVCAGLPTAQNTFIFAQEYKVAETLANRGVMVTTTLSLLTLAASAALLGR
jgi:malonate transporter